MPQVLAIITNYSSLLYAELLLVKGIADKHVQASNT